MSAADQHRAGEAHDRQAVQGEPESVGVVERERRRQLQHEIDGTPDPAKVSARVIAERMKP